MARNHRSVTLRLDDPLAQHVGVQLVAERHRSDGNTGSTTLPDNQLFELGAVPATPPSATFGKIVSVHVSASLSGHEHPCCRNLWVDVFPGRIPLYHLP